jgi:hypothetical protein
MTGNFVVGSYGWHSIFYIQNQGRFASQKSLICLTFRESCLAQGKEKGDVLQLVYLVILLITAVNTAL